MSTQLRDSSGMALQRARAMTADAPFAGAQACLTTYLTSKTLAHWRVTVDGASALSRATAVRVIAFHPEERRVISGPRSVEAAKSLIVREGLSIDRVRVVNRSREHGRIYAAPVGYLDSLMEGDPSSTDLRGSENRPTSEQTADPRNSELRIEAVAPGLMLVDRLLARAGASSPAHEGRPFAVLIDLCAPGDEASESRLKRERLVIGVVLSDASTQPAVICSVTDEPVKDVARLVLYEQKLADDAPWVLFNAAEVLTAANDVAFYPSEPEWSGVPIRRILNGVLAASAALAVAGAAFAVDTLYRIQRAEATSSEARQRVDQLQNEVGLLMRRRPSALAGELSLDPGGMLDRAGALWRAGAKVALDTRGGTTEYTISVPFTQARMNFQNRPSAYSVTDRARVATVLAIDPPSGCTRSGLRATGALNEVSLVVSCENPNSALARFLPR